MYQYAIFVDTDAAEVMRRVALCLEHLREHGVPETNRAITHGVNPAYVAPDGIVTTQHLVTVFYRSDEPVLLPEGMDNARH